MKKKQKKTHQVLPKKINEAVEDERKGQVNGTLLLIRFETTWPRLVKSEVSVFFSFETSSFGESDEVVFVWGVRWSSKIF